MSLPEDLKKTYVSDLEAGIIANLIKPKVAIVGRSDTGKSTLINALLGVEKMPVAWTPMTSIAVYLKHIDDNWLGLTGLVAFLSYTLAVVISPSAFPGYNWMEQAVSDLSAESAPSRMLWNQIAALYNVCSVVCVTCVSVYISENKVSSRLFRIGMHVFTIMNWISNVGYTMFPLADSGKEIASFQEIMHMAVTAAVVLLSIVSLVCLIIAGFKKNGIRGIGIWAAVALLMMMIGAIGKGAVPPQYFGIVERFSVFAAVGFNAVCGIYLFRGFAFRQRL